MVPAARIPETLPAGEVFMPGGRVHYHSFADLFDR